MTKPGFDKQDVPAVAVPRLTLYLRKLRDLESQGISRVSSRDLADMIGFNAAQIRKDLSYLGEFGTRGVGYEVARLVEEIEGCLGLNRAWNVVIVGAGLLGTALARYRGFSEQGFRLVGLFDSAEAVVGTSYGEGLVRSVEELEEVCRRGRVDIAMVTVPAAAAARLGGMGVKAILNFAPVKVNAPEGILVRQVDLSSELMSLTYFLQRGES